jgi:hypothetical protein
MDLGIDKNGYRNECHELKNPPQWIWKYGAPGDTRDSTLPHDPVDADGKLPRYLTITAVVSPAEKAGSVSFSVAGDEPDCIVIDKKTVKEDGVVELQIRALKASTPAGTLTNPTRKPNGTLIQAVYKGKVVGKGKYYVLKPFLIKKDPTLIKAATGITATTLPFHAEYEGQPVSDVCSQGDAPPMTVPRTYYLLWCDIFILDQYKIPLAGMYAGTSVEEKFPNGPQIWVAWMGTGSFSDPVGSTVAEDSFNVTHQVKIAGWDLSNIMKRNLDFEFPVVNGQIRTDLTISHAP